MKAVVDASVAVSLMLNPSLRAISAQLAGYDSLHAPGHFDVECTSAFRKAMLRGSLTFEQFGRLALAVPLFPVRRHLIGDLVPRMVEISRNSTMYDAAYIALAEGLSADLISSDKRLRSVPGLRCRVLQLPENQN
jgi:predicted nucleic acid-binding protein